MSRELLDEQVKNVQEAGGTVASAHLREERPAEELGAGLMVVGAGAAGDEEDSHRERLRSDRHARRPILVVGAGA